MTRALVATACLGLALGCSRAEAPPPPSPAASASASPKLLTLPPALLDTGRVRLTSVIGATEAQARFVASARVVAPPGAAADIGSRFAGRVKRLLVKPGQAVQRGELLATLDVPEAARAAGALAEAHARRRHAAAVLEQERRLVAEQATSQRALLEAESAVAAAQAEEGAARLLLSGLSVRGSEVSLRAPFDGTVVSVQVEQGSAASAESSLLRVVALDRLVLAVELPELRSLRVLPGSRVTLRGVDGRRCEGVLQGGAGRVDPARRSVRHELLPDPGCPRWPEGAYVEVELRQTEPTPSAAAPAPSASSAPPDDAALVAVPRRAVVELSGVPTVFVAVGPPGSFELRHVRVVQHTELDSVLEGPLKPGEQVVSQGALLLKGEWMRAELE